MIKKTYLSFFVVCIFGFTCAHAEELHPAVAYYNTLSNTDQQKCVNKVIFNKKYQDALYLQLYKNINTDIDSTTKNTTGSSGETLTSITADHIIELCQNDLGQAVEALVQLVNQGKKFTTYYWQVNREGKPIQSLNIAPSDLLNALNIDVGIMITNHDYTIDQWATRDSEKDVCKIDKVDTEYPDTTGRSQNIPGINNYDILNKSINHSIAQNESLKLPDGYQPYGGFFPRGADWFSPLIRYRCCKGYEKQNTHKTYPWHSTDILAFTKAAHALANSYKQTTLSGEIPLELQQLRICDYKAYVVAINTNCDPKTVNTGPRTTYYTGSSWWGHTPYTTNCVKVLYGPIKLTK